MSLVYITGISGMGKSTIMQEMRNQNIEVYGIDEDPLGVWVNRATGEIDDMHKAAKNDDFDVHDWFNTHAWTFDTKKIETLAKKSEGRTVYFCGVAQGYDAIKRFIDKVIVLHTDDQEELIKRIKERKDNDYGKHPRDLEKILGWQAIARNFYGQIGAIFIDAKQNPKNIVDEIVKL